MKIKIFFLILSGLFFLISCQQETVDPVEEVFPSKKSAIAGESQLLSFSINSEALNSQRNVNVYLPKSYEACPKKSFPVIYFLHGMPAWENMLLDPVPFELFFQMAQLSERVDFPTQGFQSWIDNLIDNEGMREAIIVMPDASTFFGPSVYLNSPIIGNMEDFIVKDLVSFIDANFRTKTHFNWRAVTGHCAGGYGAFHLAMKHPKVFRYVGALSPAHFPEPTMMAIATFMPIEDQIWQANYNVPSGPIPYKPSQPFKFANGSAYALCQGWLPNPANPPYLCDLPFTYVDGLPVINSELMAKVDAQNLLALTKLYRKNLNMLKTVYWDCGSSDELGMFLPNQMLHEQLEKMHVKHRFEAYDGTHISHLYNRLGKVFVDLSNDFPGGH